MTPPVKVSAIVLAAGQSRRMGQPKMLLPWGGQPIITRAVDAAAAANEVREVIVVTGAEHEALCQAVSQIHKLVFVRNPEPARGMLSSVRCGLGAIAVDAHAVAILLGDQPGLDPAVIDAVIEAYRCSGRSICLPTYAGRRGHPLVFDVRYRAEILERYDDLGLRGLLTAHPEEVCEVPLEHTAILEDIDTPEDYRRLSASRSL